MHLKRICGIVLIASGVIALIGGALQYHDLVVAGDTSTVMTAPVTRYVGNILTGSTEVNNGRKIIHPERMLSLMFIFVGGLLAILGTLMLKNTMPKSKTTYEDELAMDELETPRFKL